MDFILSLCLFAVREYLDRNKDLVEQIDRTSKIHPDLLQGFKNSGLYGLSVPEKFGGADLYFTEIGRWEESSIVNTYLRFVLQVLRGAWRLACPERGPGGQ